MIAESRHLTTQAVTQTGTASTKAYITAEEAKNAALAHAGIAESSVAQLEIEFDSEDGLMVYEVEFYAGGTEYDYDINARTGEVVNFSREGGISGGTTGSSGSYIGEAAATGRRPDPRRRQRSGHHLSPLLGGARRRAGGVLRGGVPGGHHGVSV